MFTVKISDTQAIYGVEHVPLWVVPVLIVAALFFMVMLVWVFRASMSDRNINTRARWWLVGVGVFTALAAGSGSAVAVVHSGHDTHTLVRAVERDLGVKFSDEQASEFRAGMQDALETQTRQRHEVGTMSGVTVAYAISENGSIEVETI